MSSSDGQRFPGRGKSLTSREMVLHGGRVLSTYTHVSDQWSTYGTKIILPTAREAHYALDEFLGNATAARIGRSSSESASDAAMSPSSAKDIRVASAPRWAIRPLSSAMPAASSS